MKRQAISISLGDLKKIKEHLQKELKDIETLSIVNKLGRDKIRFQLDIVNFPTVSGNKEMYCSDTWEFDMLLREEIEVTNEDELE